MTKLPIVLILAAALIAQSVNSAIAYSQAHRARRQTEEALIVAEQWKLVAERFQATSLRLAEDTKRSVDGWNRCLSIVEKSR